MMTAVLVVDDDLQVRQSLLDYFCTENFNVFESSNGLEAIEVMKQENIDVVFIDIFMPEMDGLETIGEMRQHWPDVKIVLMSGGPEHLSSRDLGADLLDAGVGLGANISLQKPFSLSEAVMSVKRLLAG